MSLDFLCIRKMPQTAHLIFPGLCPVLHRLHSLSNTDTPEPLTVVKSKYPANKFTAKKSWLSKVKRTFSFTVNVESQQCVTENLFARTSLDEMFPRNLPLMLLDCFF